MPVDLPPISSRTIFLVGFMASGKSACGRVLAERLGRPFCDTDQRVVDAAGRPIDRIFEESGEGRFRELEAEVLATVVDEPPAVVATGGGLFVGHAQRRLILDRGLAVWLDVPLETATERIAERPEQAPRPLWLGADRLSRRVMFEKRRAVYALAHHRVDASLAEPEQIAARIADWLHSADFR